MLTPNLDDDMTNYRPSMEETLMYCAFAMAARGTCERAFVGAVFALEGRVISSGYNGTYAGQPHCEHRNYEFGSYERPRPIPEWVTKWIIETRPRYDGFGEMKSGLVFKGPPSPGDVISYDNGTYGYHFRGSKIDLPACTRALHAEENAVVFAARHGISLRGSILYITMMPCQECVPMVAGCGAVGVVTAERRKNPAGEEMLRAAGLEVMVLADVPEVGSVGL